MDGQLFPLLLLALLVAGFWFLVVSPARKRQREQEAVVRALAPGQRVLLASGMVATVHEVGDGEIEVEIAPGVVATVVAQAVLRLLDPPAAGEPGAVTGSSDTVADVPDEAGGHPTDRAPGD